MGLLEKGTFICDSDPQHGSSMVNQLPETATEPHPPKLRDVCVLPFKVF